MGFVAVGLIQSVDKIHDSLWLGIRLYGFDDLINLVEHIQDLPGAGGQVCVSLQFVVHFAHLIVLNSGP